MGWTSDGLRGKGGMNGFTCTQCGKPTMNTTHQKADSAAREVLAALVGGLSANSSWADANLSLVTEIIERHFTRQRDDGSYTRLVDGWFKAYAVFFGYQYSFSAKDGKAAKQLLAEMQPEQVVRLAEQAWRFREDSRRHFNCKFSVTIHGLQTRLNEIRSELGAATLASWQVAPVISREKF